MPHQYKKTDRAQLLLEAKVKKRWAYSETAGAWISREWTPQRFVRQVIIEQLPREQLIEAIAAHLRVAAQMYGYRRAEAVGTPREWYAALARPL